MELKEFLDAMTHCFQELLAATDRYPEGVYLRDEWVPQIQFHPDE